MASKWRQIGGDMGWSSYGVTLAKDNPGSEQVELVNITPWLEQDSSAIPDYGLYDVRETTFDYDDLNDVDSKDAKSARQYYGMDEHDYAALTLVDRAEMLAATIGYSDDRSTNDLLKALPDKPENIEFWAGPATVESVEADNADMRREALDKLFDTSLKFGKMPEDDAIEFAVEGGFTQELDDNDRAGYGYARLWHKMPSEHRFGGDIDLPIKDADDFKDAIEGLAAAAALNPAEFTPHEMNKLREYLDPPGDEPDENLQSLATELGESAAELAVKMMETVGFTWR